MYQRSYLGKFIQMDGQKYLWYKLCVFYHAKTELFDRGLTDLRSPYDPTEAYIDGRVRSYSNAYALNMRQFVNYVGKKLGLTNYNLNDFNHCRFSAQGWIDEYNRLVDAGEMDFINRFTT